MVFGIWFLELIWHLAFGVFVMNESTLNIITKK
jgi:hypothetical protein